MQLYRDKPQYPASHRFANTRMAAEAYNSEPFEAYIYQPGAPTDHLRGATPKPGDYIIRKDDQSEWVSDKTFFESMYEPVSEPNPEP